MIKRFNTTGICVSRKHYMVNITNKLKEIRDLIDNEFYFTINRPRQYGKTTTLSELKKALKEEYLVISISFEGIGDKIFEDEESFSKTFIELLSDNMVLTYEEESMRLISLAKDIKNIKDLSKTITNFVKNASKEVILFIDEVDKSSNNQLFLSFIGMLRNKYLLRETEEDYTFKSVILVGLYDVKSLKLKVRPNEEAKYNSPWNIAVDFNVDMSFSPKEISTMLKEYCKDNNVTMDIEEISKEIYFFTSGYPFLVSRLCQIVDGKICKDRNESWTKEYIQRSVKMILEEKNTLFDTLIKNLENNKELYDYIQDLIIRLNYKSFNNYNPIIEIGTTYGYFKNNNGKVSISNKIFAELIYNYMISKLENNNINMNIYNFKDAFLKSNGGLDIEKILKRFSRYKEMVIW